MVSRQGVKLIMYKVGCYYCGSKIKAGCVCYVKTLYQHFTFCMETLYQCSPFCMETLYQYSLSVVFLSNSSGQGNPSCAVLMV